MKIQAINTNTNFKGLFTDKSKEYNDWRMEYQPYSWERSYDDKVGKMAPKEKIDIMANALPNNEEIYSAQIGYAGRAESQDILGTVSYYKYPDGRMRSTITEMPAMNRENSLIVLNDKLDKFIEKKQSKREALESKIYNINTAANRASNDYDAASINEQNSFWRSNKHRVEMDKAKKSLKNNKDFLYDEAQNYIKLMASIDEVRATQEANRKEIATLKNLRESGKLIDISVQNIKDANKPFEEILPNIEKAKGKFLCLPHTLMSIEDVIKFAKLNHLDIKTYINLFITRGK